MVAGQWLLVVTVDHSHKFINMCLIIIILKWAAALDKWCSITCKWPLLCSCDTSSVWPVTLHLGAISVLLITVNARRYPSISSLYQYTNIIYGIDNMCVQSENAFRDKYTIMIVDSVRMWQRPPRTLACRDHNFVMSITKNGFTMSLYSHEKSVLLSSLQI